MLRAERLVAFRRLGYNRVHYALVMPGMVQATTVFGAPCEAVVPPVAAWCGRTLRGRTVVIPQAQLAGWRAGRHVCPECMLIARMALQRGRLH